MSFGEKFVSYFYNALEEPFINWILILGGSLMACYLLLLILMRLKTGQLTYLRPFFISKRTIISYSIVTFILLLIIIYKWHFTNFFSTNHIQFILLFSVFLLLVLQASSFFRFSSFFDRNKSSLIFYPGIGSRSSNETRNMAVREYNKTKIWLILPLFSFLLLLVPENNKNLISILIDNSSSMNGNGETNAPIEIGKTAITNTLSCLDSKTDIILSWFSSPLERGYKSNFNEIKKERQSTNLSASNNGFIGTGGALSYLNNISIIPPTPLIETIWSNFLYSKEFSQENQYDKKVSIIITDGKESVIQDDINSFSFCETDGPESFFDNISIINMGGKPSDPFFRKASGCSIYIEENGLDEVSYENALNQFLIEFIKDWAFIMWLALLAIIPILISLMIHVQKY